MISLPDDIVNLVHEYMKKNNGERPAPYNWDEWNDFEQYKEYLKKELGK